MGEVGAPGTGPFKFLKLSGCAEVWSKRCIVGGSPISLEELAAKGWSDHEYLELTMPMNTVDLTQRPPRSPRVQLGGFVILPRMLDKGRALLAGKNGEYKYACPLDQRFLEFAGVDPEALKNELATGKGDGEILEWILSNCRNKRAEFETKLWSDFQTQRAPADLEARGYFNDLHAKVASKREDIATWFDLLDLDDFVSFGGRA